MTLSSRLQDDMTQAIRDRDELRRDTLRMVIAAAYNTQKAAGRELSDDEVVQILTREVKTRRESVDAYTANDRPEAAAKEIRNIIKEQGLPEQQTRLRVGVKGGGCSGFSYMLGLTEERTAVHLSSFDRANLWFGVVPARGRERLETLLRLLRGDDRMAIVYAPTRGLTESIATTPTAP